MISVKKEKMTEMTAERQFSSNEIEKLLELQNSNLLRRLPGFGFPEIGLIQSGSGSIADETEVTVYGNRKKNAGAEGNLDQQQKMIQNLLKHYQNNLVMDGNSGVGGVGGGVGWMNSKNSDPKCGKKRFSTGDLTSSGDFEKKRGDSEKPVKENIPMEELKNKLKLKRESEEGKAFSKQRKTNFTSKEVETLLDCVRTKKEVILFGVAGGRGWAKAWQDIAKVVSKAEGIPRSEGDVRKKWTYLKWEAKNTSKPRRDPVSKQVLNILTSRDREVQEAMSLRNMEFPEDVPPANPSQQQQQQHQTQQQQQTPQASPQSQPQPSPPPSLSQKKSGLPTLAPKPTGAKLPQSSGGSSSATIKQLPKLLPKPQSPPEVCLRWNSYHSNMQNTFPSLLNNEQFVDVTLACDGRSIKCHKVMLSACSPYMEELLSSNPCQHPIIFLKDMKFWQLQALIDFMYRGEVNVTQDKLPSLLSAAEALQIKGLASPVNHSVPPKITQVQSMAGNQQHDLSEEMDQVTYMRHLQLQTDVKKDYEDEYMQDVDESPPPTPRAKKRKTSHAISHGGGGAGGGGGGGSGTGTGGSTGSGGNGGNSSSKHTSGNKSKREKERHSSTPSTSHHLGPILANSTPQQPLANQQQSAVPDRGRKFDQDKMTDDETEFKLFPEENRHSTGQDEDLDIDEKHAQIILERYSSQNDDYSRGGGEGDPDGEMDDNSTISG